MIEIIGIITTILAVAGVLTNNRRLRVCFLLWMISNALTAGIHAYMGIWSLLVRDAIFFVLAIEGWIKWGQPIVNNEKKNEMEETKN
jgi:nicotinamide riboside transporter PnuC